MMDFAEMLETSQEIRIAQAGPKIGPAPIEMIHKMDYFRKQFTSCAEVEAEYKSTDAESALPIVAFAIISIIFTSSVAYMMKKNPQLMAHPNRLIFYMCICEGIIAWHAMIAHLCPERVVCYFKLQELFEHTTFWKNDDQSILALLGRTNYNILSFFEFLSLSLNLCLCLDIVFTMRNPFYPHERRMKFYLPCSLLLATLAFVTSLRRIKVDNS